MFWGVATLVLFILYITTKGELGTYIAFFKPQPNTSDNSASSAIPANPTAAANLTSPTGATIWNSGNVPFDVPPGM